MKKTILFLAVIALAATACGPDKDTKELMEKAKTTFGTIPTKMPGAENDTEALIALGKSLYFEKALSINNTQSCNSCHILDSGKKGGVDNLPTSPGAEGKNGGRNSPTTLNAGFHFAQFWDGRAKDLVEQAGGPILNPIEMGMPSEEAAIKKIADIASYKDMFAKAFPEEKGAITYANITKAIGAFERTLVTHDRFDDFQNGNTDALTKEEKEGLKLFMDTGCTSCHSGNMLGANSYRKMGQVKPYTDTKDTGRHAVTKDEADKFLFKVPSLRNIAITDPYFHDGAAKTLEESIKVMADIQLGKTLTDEETAKIAAFLKALTDKERM